MSNYGMEIMSPDGETVVFSDSIRTSNIQLMVDVSLNKKGTTGDSQFISCRDANDTSKVLITFLDARGLVVGDKTSTGFWVSNEDDYFATRSGTVIALRVG